MAQTTSPITYQPAKTDIPLDEIVAETESCMKLLDTLANGITGYIRGNQSHYKVIASQNIHRTQVLICLIKGYLVLSPDCKNMTQDIRRTYQDYREAMDELCECLLRWIAKDEMGEVPMCRPPTLFPVQGAERIHEIMEQLGAMLYNVVMKSGDRMVRKEEIEMEQAENKAAGKVNLLDL